MARLLPETENPTSGEPLCFCGSDIKRSSHGKCHMAFLSVPTCKHRAEQSSMQLSERIRDHRQPKSAFLSFPAQGATWPAHFRTKEPSKYLRGAGQVPPCHSSSSPLVRTHHLTLRVVMSLSYSTLADFKCTCFRLKPSLRLEV